jgi:hypothetical protein
LKLNLQEQKEICFFTKKIEDKIMQLDANKTSLGGIKRRMK